MAIGRVNTGGGSLNYKIRASASAPTGAGSPNEIVVVTAAPIGDMQINCATAPSTRSDWTALQAGDCYIALLSTSSVPFNALKRNALYGLPGRCYQYIGGAWSGVDAYIYQSSAWTQFSSATVYLYNAGDECTDLTGGWAGRAWAVASTYTATTPVITKNATNIKLRLNGSATVLPSGVLEVLTDVDFTIFDTLTIAYDAAISDAGGSKISMIVLPRTTQYFYGGVAVTTLATGTSVNVSDQTKSIDVSAITGSYDIAIGGGVAHKSASYYIQTVLHSIYLS